MTDRIADVVRHYDDLVKNPNPMFSTGEKYYIVDVPYLLTEIDCLNAELADLRADYNGVMRIQAELLHDKQYLNSHLEASQRREQAAVEDLSKYGAVCETCNHECCSDCAKMGERWEWRGPQEGGE